MTLALKMRRKQAQEQGLSSPKQSTLPSPRGPARASRGRCLGRRREEQRASGSLSNQDPAFREPMAAPRAAWRGPTTLPVMPRGRRQAAAVKRVTRHDAGAPASRSGPRARCRPPAVGDARAVIPLGRPPLPGPRSPRRSRQRLPQAGPRGGGGGLEAVAGSARATESRAMEPRESGKVGLERSWGRPLPSGRSP